MEHTCEAAVITCIDFRFWQKLVAYLADRGLTQYDLVSMAGGAKNVLDENTRDTIFRMLGICTEKHCIKKVVLVNHIDCGAYGGSGAFANKDEEVKKLISDMNEAEKLILEKYPELIIEKLLMDFDEVKVIKLDAKSGV
jgi:carbonic anhydrase